MKAMPRHYCSGEVELAEATIDTDVATLFVPATAVGIAADDLGAALHYAVFFSWCVPLYQKVGSEYEGAHAAHRNFQDPQSLRSSLDARSHQSNCG